MIDYKKNLFLGFARIYLLDEIAKYWERGGKSEKEKEIVLQRIEELELEASALWYGIKDEHKRSV